MYIEYVSNAARRLLESLLHIQSMKGVTIPESSISRPPHSSSARRVLGLAAEQGDDLITISTLRVLYTIQQCTRGAEQLGRDSEQLRLQFVAQLEEEGPIYTRCGYLSMPTRSCGYFRISTGLHLPFLPEERNRNIAGSTRV